MCVGCGTMDSEFFTKQPSLPQEIVPISVVVVEEHETNVDNRSLSTMPIVTHHLVWNYRTDLPAAFDILRTFDIKNGPWTKIGITTNTFFAINTDQQQAYFNVGVHKQ